MHVNLDRAVSICIGLAALGVGGSVVYRTFFESPPVAPEIEYLADWQTGLPAGTLLAGLPNAPIKVVVLSDYECPACALFHKLSTGLRGRIAADVQIRLVHYPLSYHPSALTAALAGECLARRGRIEAWSKVAFEKQDSFGHKSIASFVQEAGESDTASISACIISGQGRPAIDSGLAYGERIDLDGTPTVLVNGWRFRDPPTPEKLQAVIAAVRDGQKPEVPK